MKNFSSNARNLRGNFACGKEKYSGGRGAEMLGKTAIFVKIGCIF